MTVNYLQSILYSTGYKSVEGSFVKTISRCFALESRKDLEIEFEDNIPAGLTIIWHWSLLYCPFNSKAAGQLAAIK